MLLLRNVCSLHDSFDFQRGVKIVKLLKLKLVQEENGLHSEEKELIYLLHILYTAKCNLNYKH